MDATNELLQPPGIAPLATAEPIYHDFPLLVGGPHHGEPAPIGHDWRTALLSRGIEYGPESARQTDAYVRGKFTASYSRRVLRIWHHDGLTEAEISALTWLLILESAGLT